MSGGIDTVEDLRAHLQTAIEIEHSTLPPYLCALYSIAAGTNPEAIEVIQSVVLEEMLHLTLAANVLNAVGGSPLLHDARLLPAHPCLLPHSRGIEVGLGPFTPTALEVFMAVERPASADALPEDDGWETLGQFYAAIESALVALSGELGEAALFAGDPDRQVTMAQYYGGAGRIIAVTDLESACRALHEIVDQGEGLDHGAILDGDRNMFRAEREEIAHYFRFHELAVGRRYQAGDTPQSGPSGAAVEVDWGSVAPVRPNPRVADFPPGSDARLAMDAFNRCYCDVLRLLHLTLNGMPELLAATTGAMYGLKAQMVDLMRIDSGDGMTTAGPSFEWVPEEDRHVDGLRIAVLPGGPYLVSGDIAIYGADGGLRKRGGQATLCRCGGSRTKPFCDGTHARIDFRSEERADHGLIADRRAAYPTPGGVTIYDDRHRCAHFGQCTGRLPSAFGVDEVAFVDPTAAPSADLIAVTTGCPSGALAFAPAGQVDPEESHEQPSMHPIVDGPYRVRGGITVIAGDGRPYEVRERQTLCRCGQSMNKPFCDGSHWYAGFRDPAPTGLDPLPIDQQYPWTDPDAAARGRERYAAEQAEQAEQAEKAERRSDDPEGATGGS